MLLYRRMKRTIHEIRRSQLWDRPTERPSGTVCNEPYVRTNDVGLQKLMRVKKN